MRGVLETAGERMAIECEVPWLSELIEEGAAGQLQAGPAMDTSLVVRVEADSGPFDVSGAQPVTRGAWRRDGAVIVENACTTGLDIHVRCSAAGAQFTVRWRAPARERVARWLLPARFRLLARAVLLQFPALWWAGTRGRAPLHASTCTAGPATPLLAGPGGVGKSTLLLRELTAGGRAICDNLCVADGTVTWGLVEPVRVETSNLRSESPSGLQGGNRSLSPASRRRMPHGRREAVLPGRIPSLVPDRVVVLGRSPSGRTVVRRCDSDAGVRSLVTGTYMAGELRRFWDFAATLAAGTGRGPAHPPVEEVAARFATRLPCLELLLPEGPTARLADLLRPLEAIA